MAGEGRRKDGVARSSDSVWDSFETAVSPVGAPAPRESKKTSRWDRKGRNPSSSVMEKQELGANVAGAPKALQPGAAENYSPRGRIKSFPEGRSNQHTFVAATQVSAACPPTKVITF